jgi:hypothetical protein
MVALIGTPSAMAAQDAAPQTRAALIEREQAAKAATLRPYEPDAGERLAQKAQDILVNGGLNWHPFFESAYSGGGFTLGVGYMRHVSPYNRIDLRGSYTVSNYKRVEAEFIAPRLFKRRGVLSVLGGWREATQVGFYGIGGDTSEADRTNYQFDQPYGSALLTLRPTRGALMLRGGFEWSRWSQGPGDGDVPSVETRYAPETLPGLGATIDYFHTEAAVGLDSRPSSGYSRRGSFVAVTGHDYTDRDGRFGFLRVDYEAVQHIPILREAWVVSLHGLVSTTHTKSGQEIPFFMLPALGGGSTLRGYSSWRFRDFNSLLLQAEWRIIVNRYFDTAVFYDTGKVAARRSDLDVDGFRHDAGFGIRFHGPMATPLRVDLAKGPEGLSIVFASSAVF